MKQRTRAVWAVAASMLALGLAAGCAKGASTASTSQYRAQAFHPLALGNEWTYTGRMMGQPLEKTIRITGQKDGFFVDDANGMLKVDAEGLRDEKRYLLREPLERGRTWMSQVSVSSNERYEIVDTGFTVSTPAGSFNDCVKVRAMNRIDKEKEMRVEWVYAPNVGIVRMTYVMKVKDQEIPQGQIELKNYRVH